MISECSLRSIRSIRFETPLLDHRLTVGTAHPTSSVVSVGVGVNSEPAKREANEPNEENRGSYLRPSAARASRDRMQLYAADRGTSYL